MAFQLDTSGAVLPINSDDPILSVQEGITWHDLSPFTQGYIEALMRTLRDDDLGYLPLNVIKGDLRFGNLAPETLARIIADCEAWCAEYSGTDYDAVVESADAGGRAWNDRQNGRFYRSSFPPLTVQLGDDGKVRFQ